MTDSPDNAPQRGRGTSRNPRCRYHDTWVEREPQADLPRVTTEVRVDSSRSILSRNQSPDVPFDRSINPYRGCEHGCIYCFARPTHAYLGLSPGLDFETKLVAKPEAAALLRRALAKTGYRCAPIAMGTNTDPYQPVERTWQVTRQVLEVLAECNHPVAIVTKSALVERDLDLLAPMAERGLAHVLLSLTTLDRELSRRMEPRAAAPERRLRTIERLRAHGIPTGVLLAPLIPALNDAEVESLLAAAHRAGAVSAGYVVLRLPLEVSGLFGDWLQQHYPLRAKRVLAQVRAMRNGRENDPRFGSRMVGEGPWAALLAQRFERARRRLGLTAALPPLDTSAFRPPGGGHGQLALF